MYNFAIQNIFYFHFLASIFPTFDSVFLQKIIVLKRLFSFQKCDFPILLATVLCDDLLRKNSKKKHKTKDFYVCEVFRKKNQLSNKLCTLLQVVFFPIYNSDLFPFSIFRISHLSDFSTIQIFGILLNSANFLNSNYE